MRNPNPHRPELVAAVHTHIVAGLPLHAACAATLADPPTYLYPRLTPSALTLSRWFMADTPEYHEIRTGEAHKLLDTALSQIQVSAHFGVTTRTSDLMRGCLHPRGPPTSCQIFAIACCVSDCNRHDTNKSSRRPKGRKPENDA